MTSILSSAAAGADPIAFIRANTAVAAPSLLPEMRLHLAGEVTPLWHATEENLRQNNLPPPYWAFAWPGGQAVARWALDNPQQVRGRRVLDFAAGSGVTGIAAAMAGAAQVIAAEIDGFAAAALGLNAALNNVTLTVIDHDIVGRPLEGELAGVDLVLAGDVCYERPMAERVISWFRLLAAQGATVVIGDPGRAYVPRSGLESLGSFTVPTSLDLEDRDRRETVVWRFANP